MNLQERIDLMTKLGEYISSPGSPDNNLNSWQQAKEKAGRENGWFTPEFIDLAVKHIARAFLQKDILEQWAAAYQLPELQPLPRQIGIVMAGNIPLVGFHDLLCAFISGHTALIKPSSKDETLIKHIAAILCEWNREVNECIRFEFMLKGSDAYIATGSNNSAGYFEYYFKKYPHIIRRNRTSVAILSGEETSENLSRLADDVYLYFGLGCRNVTKIYVPEGYDFIPLLTAFKKYDRLADHFKYKNNYDYNLAILLLNKKIYMSNASILLAEEASVFSPISQLNYEFYTNYSRLTDSLKDNPAIQCIVSKDEVTFGQSQFPGIFDYADGIDTLAFCAKL